MTGQWASYTKYHEVSLLSKTKTGLIGLCLSLPLWFFSLSLHTTVTKRKKIPAIINGVRIISSFQYGHYSFTTSWVCTLYRSKKFYPFFPSSRSNNSTSSFTHSSEILIISTAQSVFTEPILSIAIVIPLKPCFTHTIYGSMPSATNNYMSKRSIMNIHRKQHFPSHSLSNAQGSNPNRDFAIEIIILIHDDDMTRENT